MDIEAEYSFLSHLPTHYFKRLVDKWENTSIELEPNGLLSNENRETTMSFISNMKDSRLKQLKKLSEILDISDVWWEIYQFSEVIPFSHIKKRQKAFSVEKYLPEDHSKVKGIFSIKDISEHAILLLAEFSSRSTALKRLFRFIYLPSVKTILLEPKDLSTEILNNEILPFITAESDKITQKRVRARFVRDLTKDRDEGKLSLALTHLKIKISLETSGIEGLNQIIIQGDNVIRGAETLEQRHEISLRFMNSGPWIAAGTKDFSVEVGKGLQIHQLEESSFKNLSTVLSWL
ncbi:MAG: hypothetical protein JSW11_20965 [Candidatus Heimdallarchaeota archaeon]|nr:MAG: hypothetical protein JSW11_20965 [Candidatus Heimdallarchaeota archaeon]